MCIYFTLSTSPVKMLKFSIWNPGCLGIFYVALVLCHLVRFNKVSHYFPSSLISTLKRGDLRSIDPVKTSLHLQTFLPQQSSALMGNGVEESHCFSSLIQASLSLWTSNHHPHPVASPSPCTVVLLPVLYYFDVCAHPSELLIVLIHSKLTFNQLVMLTTTYA